MTKVLVTDAQMRNSLAIIRSLGSKGLEKILKEFEFKPIRELSPIIEEGE